MSQRSNVFSRTELTRTRYHGHLRSYGAVLRVLVFKTFVLTSISASFVFFLLFFFFLGGGVLALLGKPSLLLLEYIMLGCYKECNKVLKKVRIIFNGLSNHYNT